VPEVSLRPVTEQDLTRSAEAFSDERGWGSHQWFGYRGQQRDLERLRDNGMLCATEGRLTIDADGQWAGCVDWFRSSWGRPEESWCWSLGVVVAEPLRGKGIGTEAQRQAVAYLFAHTRAERIQAWTDAGNLAEQRVLDKLGFTREGTLRDAQWRAGAWHDQVLYSRLRSDGGPWPPVLSGES
jgi:aminoglycoside 6'-N-acetyltransferase